MKGWPYEEKGTGPKAGGPLKPKLSEYATPEFPPARAWESKAVTEARAALNKARRLDSKEQARLALAKKEQARAMLAESKRTASASARIPWKAAAPAQKEKRK